MGNRFLAHQGILIFHEYRYMKIHFFLSEAAKFYTHLLHFIRLLPNRVRLRIKFFGHPIRIHPSTRVSRRSIIETVPLRKGSIRIGENCLIHDHAKIQTLSGGVVELGEDCSVNDFTIIRAGGKITIGNHVRIVPHCCIIDINYNFDRPDVLIRLQGRTTRPIVVEDDVWIGANTCILGGVTIGKGSVIGAGSVVLRSIPMNSVAYGNPARVARRRGMEDVSGTMQE